MKRSKSVPVPSPSTASVRTLGISKDATDWISPTTTARCRGTNAATAMGLSLTS